MATIPEATEAPAPEAPAAPEAAEAATPAEGASLKPTPFRMQPKTETPPAAEPVAEPAAKMKPAPNQWQASFYLKAAATAAGAQRKVARQQSPCSNERLGRFRDIARELKKKQSWGR